MSQVQRRIHSAMGYENCVAVLAGGNPGSIQACIQLGSAQSRIMADPKEMFYPLLWLDTYGIWDENIYAFFHDVCGNDPYKALALIEAAKFGVAGCTQELIHESIRLAKTHNAIPLDVDVIYKVMILKVPDTTGPPIPK